MFVVLNIILVLVALFIAYWWANQGLFSSILHLVCVIVAGALALAFWEPLTSRILLRGGGFDDYAWGLSLIVLFAVLLLILRLAMDKVAPANVQVPHWADLVFGGAAGVCSGILTVGIFLIAAGHVQSSAELMGYRGYGRGFRTAAVGPINKLWVPFDKLTSDFYERMSVTSFRSKHPMRQYTPNLYQQATLLRDSYSGGKGKLSLKPSTARVDGLYFAEKSGRDTYFVKVDFDLGALDFGEQLTLSASQVRLIGAANGTAKPEVVHPYAWRQYSGYHLFDNISHYISSEPAKESAEVEIEFQVPTGFSPRFLQVRNARYDLPSRAEPAPGYLLVTAGEEGVVELPPGGQDIQSSIRISSDIRPVIVTTNKLPGTMQQRDFYLTAGTAKFQRGRSAGAASNLRIKGIVEPTGTKLVKLDVSRGGPADVFRIAGQVGEDATLELVDARGGTYSPIGYMYGSGGSTEIVLAPNKRVRTLAEIPALPTSGSHELLLLYYVTQGNTVTGFRAGDTVVGYCDLPIPKEDDD